MLPYGILGEAMLWQAASGMYFRMAEGYVTFAPPVPEQHSRWPIVAGLYQLRGVPAAGDQFKAYLASNGVGAVIVGRRRQYRVGSIDGRPTATTWLRAPTLAPERDATSAMLASLEVPAIETGGVTLYQLSPQALAPYRNLTALAMEQRAARARLEALLLGAERYLDAGGDLASLSPEHAQQLGLLPQGWFGGAFLGAGDSNPIFHSGSVLGPAAPNGIAVGDRRPARCARIDNPELRRRCDSNLFSVPGAIRGRCGAARAGDYGADVRPRRPRPRRRVSRSGTSALRYIADGSSFRYLPAKSRRSGDPKT